MLIYTAAKGRPFTTVAFFFWFYTPIADQPRLSSHARA